jgi:hypothetical protein
MVRRQRSRFLARVPRAPLRCMHAWGAARARHSPLSLQNGILRTFPDLLRSPQGFEMRVAPPHHRFSTAENRVTSTPANMHRSDRIRKISKQHAPSLPDTLADCAPPRARPHHRFSTAENRCNQLRTPTCVQASDVTGYPRYGSGPPRRAIAPRHSRRLCAATGTLPPPFLGGRKIGRREHRLRRVQYTCMRP